MTLKRSRSRNSTAAQRVGVVALGAADRLVEAVDEQHAVRQAGERVVQRVVLQARSASRRSVTSVRLPTIAGRAAVLRRAPRSPRASIQR